MLIFLSPAKSLDYKTPPHVARHSQPAFLKDSAALIAQLRQLAPADIANLMDLSDPLALLNFNRYADWSLPFTPENAKQAVLAFDGDFYDGLAARTLVADDLDFADIVAHRQNLGEGEFRFATSHKHRVLVGEVGVSDDG